jgi:CBS domain containing-hemolysin-like protein
MWFDLLLALVLVGANALFVASEFSLARLRPTQVVELERERRVGVRSLRHAAGHLDAYLAACQLGITIASIGLGVVGESAFEALLSPLVGPEAELAGIALGAALAFALITVLHVVVGELAPKSVAISRTTETALRVAPAMSVFYLATKPVVDLFNGLGNLLLRPLGIPPAREVGHAPHSEGELLQLLAESREHGLIEEDKQRLAEGVFAFADRRAGDVMRPLAGVDTRDGRQSPAPPPGRVPRKMPVTDVLRLMRDERRRTVLVAGERGRTIGVVTLEDLLEALLDGPQMGPAHHGARDRGRAI